MENIEKTLTPEQEMEQAQAALAVAKQKMAESQKMRIAKAEADLAEYRAEQEHKLLVRKLEIEDVHRRAAEQERQAAEARSLEQRKIQKEQMELEARLAKEQEEQRKQQDHEKEVQRLSNEAFRLEQLALQEESNALRMSLPVVEDAPVTLQSECHPLHFLFGKRTAAAPETPVSPVVEQPVQIELRLESPKEQQYVAQVWGTLLNSTPNPNSITQLLRRFEPRIIVTAVEIVAKDGRFKGNEMRAIESLLWKTSTLDALLQNQEDEAAHWRDKELAQTEVTKAEEYSVPIVEDTKQAASEPTPVSPAAEPVQAPELRKIEECEVNHIAMRWQSELNTRPTGAQVIPLLQRFTPVQIVEAILAVSADKRFQDRDQHFRAISAILWGNSSLDDLLKVLQAEETQRKAQRESRV